MAATATIMALMRGLHLAATLSLLGTAGFRAWMLPAAGGGSGHQTTAQARLNQIRSCCRGLRVLWWISGAVSLLAGMAWFALQAGAIAGAGSPAELWEALPVVAAHTRFGAILLVRLALVLLATMLGIETRRVYPAIGLTAVALSLQGLVGHAGAAAGAIGHWLVVSEALHLIPAGLWLGALLPLWISLRTLPATDAAMACQRFSPVGLGCVLVLAGTGLAQALALIGSLPALFGTTYGHIALLKIALFAVALVLATVNRLWLTDRLAAGLGRRHLLVSVGVETVVGLAIVTAAAFLASSVPAPHDTTVWPFPWRFSLVTLQEAPEFRQEVVASLAIIGAAALAMAAALLWQRLRLPALILLLACVVWRGPSLSLLLVEAYPTSFQTSPTGFSAASIARGQSVFLRNCAACHGPEGKGDGPATAGLRIKPTDLTQTHIMMHNDGEMFWFMTHGIDDPEGGLAMPGFRSVLPADDRWAVIDYVRAHNAAAAIHQDPAAHDPVPAPSMPIACDGTNASSMSDLRGHAVLVVLGDAAVPVPEQDAITLLVPSGDARPPPNGCVTAEAAAWKAYAVLADLPADPASSAVGTTFLIDPDGWLRMVQRPGASGAWRTREDLLAAIRGICAHPVEPSSGASHEHHH